MKGHGTAAWRHSACEQNIYKSPSCGLSCLTVPSTFTSTLEAVAISRLLLPARLHIHSSPYDLSIRCHVRSWTLCPTRHLEVCLRIVSVQFELRQACRWRYAHWLWTVRALWEEHTAYFTHCTVKWCRQTCNVFVVLVGCVFGSIWS